MAAAAAMLGCCPGCARGTLAWRPVYRTASLGRTATLGGTTGRLSAHMASGLDWARLYRYRLVGHKSYTSRR